MVDDREHARGVKQPPPGGLQGIQGDGAGPLVEEDAIGGDQ